MRWHVYGASGDYIAGRLLGTVEGDPSTADAAHPGPEAQRRALDLFARGDLRVTPGWIGAWIDTATGTTIGCLDIAPDAKPEPQTSIFEVLHG